MKTIKEAINEFGKNKAIKEYIRGIHELYTNSDSIKTCDQFVDSLAIGIEIINGDIDIGEITTQGELETITASVINARFPVNTFPYRPIVYTIMDIVRDRLGKPLCVRLEKYGFDKYLDEYIKLNHKNATVEAGYDSLSIGIQIITGFIEFDETIVSEKDLHSFLLYEKNYRSDVCFQTAHDIFEMLTNLNV